MLDRCVRGGSSARTSCSERGCYIDREWSCGVGVIPGFMVPLQCQLRINRIAVDGYWKSDFLEKIV